VWTDYIIGSYKVIPGFFGPTANTQLVPKLYDPQHASHAAFLKINFKISTQMQPSQRCQNLVIMVPLKTPNSAHMPNLFPLLHTPNSPLPNALPCVQSTCTRRTRGHCLVTESGKLLCSPCTNNSKCSVRPAVLLSLLSSFHALPWLGEYLTWGSWVGSAGQAIWHSDTVTGGFTWRFHFALSVL